MLRARPSIVALSRAAALVAGLMLPGACAVRGLPASSAGPVAPTTAGAPNPPNTSLTAPLAPNAPAAPNPASGHAESPGAASAASDSAPEPAAPRSPDGPYREPMPPAALAADAPARRIANLSPTACRAMLAERGLPVERDRRPTPGVGTATRLTGPLHGVRFVVPPRSSPYGVLDCRLVLALDELAALLVEQGVTTVYIDNTYRPRAHLPGSRRPSQHNYALAADVTRFSLADGRTLEVERDWPAAVGEPSCGPEAELGTDTAEALELRNLVCAIGRRGLFHHILTPNFDAAHRDHLHLDIQRDNGRASLH